MQLNIVKPAPEFVWYIRAYNPNVRGSSQQFKVIAMTKEHAVARLTVRLSVKNIMWARSDWVVTSVKQGKEIKPKCN